MGISLRWYVRGPREVQAALVGLVELARVQLSEARYPPLYASGVVYAQERGTEDWLGPREVYRRGYGDCEDLVAWRVAELVMHGARAAPLCYSPRPGLIHCVVWRPEGVEDPSRRLGM